MEILLDFYRPIIVGLNGHSLTESEREWLSDLKPFGVIFFSRNIENIGQIRTLTHDLRLTLGKDVPILIDQEGGRVQRMKSPNWPNLPASLDIGKLWRRNQLEGLQAAHYQGQLIGSFLAEVGITHVCGPCIDLLYPDANQVIGDRSFGYTPIEVIPLATSFIDGLERTGVVPIVKHIPGMGRVKVDSHTDLPVVDTSVDVLRETDWIPFQKISNVSMAMTAHIVIPEWDDKPVTTSPLAMKQLKAEFPNRQIISDCLTMGALQGNASQRVRNALDAGVDLALFSNGNEATRKNAVLAAGEPCIARSNLPELNPLPHNHIARCLEKLKLKVQSKTFVADPTRDQYQ